MPYVYSTLTNDTFYTEYNPSVEGAPQSIRHKVLVKGGTGMATKHLVTPFGIATNVSDSDLDFLKKNDAFKSHMLNGFITIDIKKIEPEVVAADMNTRDQSSPLMPQDYPDGGEINPSENDQPGAIRGNNAKSEGGVYKFRKLLRA